MGKKVKGDTPLASLAGKSDGEVRDALLPMLQAALAKVPQAGPKPRTYCYCHRRPASPCPRRRPARPCRLGTTM